jgi:hypothetical protein
MRDKVFLALALAAVGFLTACSGDTSVAPSPTPAPLSVSITNISTNPDSGANLGDSGSVTVSVSRRLSGGDPSKTVTFYICLNKQETIVDYGLKCYDEVRQVGTMGDSSSHAFTSGIRSTTPLTWTTNFVIAVMMEGERPWNPGLATIGSGPIPQLGQPGVLAFKAERAEFTWSVTVVSSLSQPDRVRVLGTAEGGPETSYLPFP